MKLTEMLIITLVITVLVCIAQLSLGFTFYLKEQICSEICFPYSYDMLDANTCSCWLPDGKLIVVDIK